MPIVLDYYARQLLDPAIGRWLHAVFVGTCANLGGADGPTQGLLWHLGTAADRTVLHVLPVTVLGLCMQLGRPTATPRRD